MYGKGILKGLGVTLKRFINTYVDDIVWWGRRYYKPEGIAHRSSKDTRGIFTIQYPEEKLPTPEEFRYVPFLVYDDADLKNHFCLISNHHPQQKLVPSLRQVDYFLMAKNPLDQRTSSNMLGKIRKISQVLAAYEINPNGTKDLGELLEEMELHLMISQRESKASRA